jgi:hypothetical protein
MDGSGNRRRGRDWPDLVGRRDVVNVRELRALIHDPANHPAPATGVPAALLASGGLATEIRQPRQRIQSSTLWKNPLPFQ